MAKNGCWIFISHSSKDIQKIRIIRNEFEKYGQNPLAFHLKCLSTETEESRLELDNLIKREIQARDWFVYCESEAAKKSYYVQMEREYVKECEKKFIWKIDLSDPLEKILLQVRKICCNTQVYISYVHQDEHIYQCLLNTLEKYDFQVTSNYDVFKDPMWNAKDRIYSISKNGFFLLLLSENYLNSGICETECLEARKNKAIILPIGIGNGILEKARTHAFYEKLLSEVSYIKINDTSIESIEDIARIIMNHIELWYI